MKKILFCLLGAVFTCGANAAIVERTDCNATRTEIDTLKAFEDPSDEMVQELAELEKIYRRDCMKRATGRRTSGHVIKQETTVPDQVAVTEDVDTPMAVVEEVQEEIVVVDTVQPADVPPAPTAEEVEANEQAGLCPNGDAPNKFGCCAGEKFTDLGNTVFACCPDEGGDCFPPLR